MRIMMTCRKREGTAAEGCTACGSRFSRAPLPEGERKAQRLRAERRREGSQPGRKGSIDPAGKNHVEDNSRHPGQEPPDPPPVPNAIQKRQGRPARFPGPDDLLM